MAIMMDEMPTEREGEAKETEPLRKRDLAKLMYTLVMARVKAT